MKTVEEMKSMLFERLAELQAGRLRPHVEEQLRVEVALLYNILGEEIAEEYWDVIEECI